MIDNEPQEKIESCADAGECSVVELRRYTLHPGRRDALIALFEREFIEPQKATGMHLIGQFRDLDAPDRFVWLRGFADMASRQRALQSFYGGPEWAAHRQAANATMIDSDNVLLLRPAWPGAADAIEPRGRAEPQSEQVPAGLIDLTIFYPREPAGADLLAWCRSRMAAVLSDGGAVRQAWFVTEPTANNFPRLPVREGEPVLVGIAVFADEAAFDRFRRSGRWQRDVEPTLAPWLCKPAEPHRLLPTPRSALHA